MGAALPLTKLSVEEYLRIDEAADHKSEYHDGELFPVVEASVEHGRLALNMGSLLKTHVKQGCTPYQAPRTRINARKFVYPDLAVVCGDAREIDISLQNPHTIVEVLSPSTADYDRGGKFGLYQTLPSFEEYVLISQEEPRVDVFSKESPDQWTLRIHRGLEQAVLLRCLGVAFSLRDLYGA